MNKKSLTSILFLLTISFGCGRSNDDVGSRRAGFDSVDAALDSDMADSVRIFNIRLKADSSDAGAYEGLTDNYLGIDSNDQAMAAFLLGVSHVPHDTNLYTRYAESLTDDETSDNYSEECEESEKVLKVGLLKIPGSFKLRLLLGEAYEKDGKYIDASHQYLLLHDSFPDRSDLLSDVAGCCIGMEAWNQLGLFSSRALDLDSTNSVAHAYLGYYYEKENHFFADQVIIQYNAAIHYDSSNSWAYLHRGLWFAHHGQNDQAWNDYRACKRINPDDADVLYHELTKD